MTRRFLLKQIKARGQCGWKYLHSAQLCMTSLLTHSAPILAHVLCYHTLSPPLGCTYLGVGIHLSEVHPCSVSAEYSTKGNSSSSHTLTRSHADTHIHIYAVFLTISSGFINAQLTLNTSLKFVITSYLINVYVKFCNQIF